MLFTEVATGRMNCEGEKKVALEDSGRVILSQQSLAAKDKIDLLPGCATWEEETAQQWCLIVLFILTALSVVRKKKKKKKRQPNPESNNANAEEFGLPDPMALLNLIAYVCY